MFLSSFASSNLHTSLVSLDTEQASRPLHGEREKKIHFHNYISSTKQGKARCEEKGHSILVLLPKDEVRSIEFSFLSRIFYWENSFFQVQLSCPCRHAKSG